MLCYVDHILLIYTNCLIDGSVKRGRRKTLNKIGNALTVIVTLKYPPYKTCNLANGTQTGE